MFDSFILLGRPKKLKFLEENPLMSQRPIFWIPSSGSETHHLKYTALSLEEKYQQVRYETGSGMKIDWSNNLYGSANEKVWRNIPVLPPIYTIIFRSRAPTCKFEGESQVISVITQPSHQNAPVFTTCVVAAFGSPQRVCNAATYLACRG